MTTANEDSNNGAISPPVAVPAQVDGAGPPPAFSSFVLNVGFAVGLFLAVCCLGIAAYYLVSYQLYAQAAMDGVQDASASAHSLVFYMYMARVLLLSCGLAVGMAFGFLGFSLFLFGIQGSMDASARGAGELGIQVARISPGAFVMLCSAILVGVCATQNVSAQVREVANEAETAEDATQRYANILNAGGGAENGISLEDVEADAANRSAAQ